MRRRIGLGLGGVLIAAALFMPIPSRVPEPRARTISIVATQYAFTPSVIRVNPGDSVTLQLEAGDVVHGLFVEGYDIEVEADPGQPATLSFVADRSGSFRLRCSVTCGPQHPFMVGKLQVGSRSLFWRALVLSALVAAGTAWSRRW